MPRHIDCGVSEAMAITPDKLRNLWRMATRPVRERGFVETYRSVRACARARALEELEAFDDAYGTDTGRTLTAVDLGADGDDVPALWRYWPTLRSSFSSIIEALPIRYEERVFVDLGSGKGRALLLASEHPFRKIIGVELSPALHRIAERNVRSWRSPSQRCHAIELVCMNARDYALPPEDALVYLFQPFPADVMNVVLDNLGRSLAEHPRAIDVVYHNPVFHELFARRPFLELERWVHGREKGEFDWVLYRARPR